MYINMRKIRESNININHNKQNLAAAHVWRTITGTFGRLPTMFITYLVCLDLVLVMFPDLLELFHVRMVWLLSDYASLL